MRGRDEFFESLTTARSSRAIPVDPNTGVRITGRMPRRDRSMYEYLFLEDVAQSLPYGGGLDKGFHLKLTPENPAIDELVLSALPAQSYGHDRLVEAFRDFLRSTTFDLVRGNLYLEIEYFHAGRIEDGEPEAFKIHILPPDSIVNRHGNHSQAVAAETEAADAALRWSLEPLDPECLVVVQLPAPLARDARRAIALLREISSKASVATDFVTGEHGRESGFDFKAYGELLNNLVLKKTRAIGWAGRGTFLEGMLDPEKAWRAIQFARFQVAVRDTVLAGIQDAVDKAGAAMGFEAKLTLSGVLTPNDLDQLEAELEHGTRPILELMHPGLLGRAEPPQ